MWPFRRKKKDDVPAEIQEYYQAERRERAGVAWLVALLTLLLTVSIVLALFFGGRWVYRRVTDDGNKQASTQSETTSEQSTESPESAPTNSGPASQQPSPPPPASESSASPPPSSESPATPSPNPTPAPVTPQSVPSAGPVSPPEQLPNSGPGNIIASFVIISLVGAVAHRLFWARRFGR